MASPPPAPAAPVFFETAALFRAWLAQHAATATELVVGFYKVGSGRPCMAWSESVDEALCVGWIDGLRTGIDALSYKIRFTPRKASSTWSAVNLAKMQQLMAQGRMQAAGLAAYEKRRIGNYSYEQADNAQLTHAHEALFRQHPQAWAFFAAQPVRYQHQMAWRILSAKQQVTRDGRLAKMIEASQHGKRL
jgi:uncharacterized protein YdeI (YjbR/CyaY-like superfamily)